MPEMPAASFPTYGRGKPSLHTVVSHYKKQSQLFPPALTLATSEGDRKKMAVLQTTVILHKDLDFIRFSVPTAGRSLAVS